MGLEKVWRGEQGPRMEGRFHGVFHPASASRAWFRIAVPGVCSEGTHTPVRVRDR